MSILVKERIKLLSSSPSLKKLSIRHCLEPIPPNVIPSTLEKLTIFKLKDQDILLQIVAFPPSLTHLSVRGRYHQDNRYTTTHQISIDDFEPQASRCNQSVAKHPSYYSIRSMINKTTILSQQQWLPHNTTHLHIHLEDDQERDDYPKGIFRLDQVINHTNVRYLSITLSRLNIHLSIQRLDADNLNVLVVETQTLQGGIIKQRKSKYQPIQLYLDADCEVFSPQIYELKWCFLDDDEDDDYNSNDNDDEDDDYNSNDNDDW
ncbi:hypothetical protein DFA_08338 [Cavenderia fasciculata]|uniref:Uncharacterized protein n=1 Tax=Cavenderia fasciculata TaxID=261658 RepID=F4Q5T4_CACFS|nr:uncharacterized protein DFA_08338 [Cavenderia fasciculata]EGG17343.1 hypothetical protein DFA_08338 [Cavenderia fasciculata]|eukprot:XP_004355827.1 hypothetical protein DFA_08338 [Cavenderia fasciculata]